MFNSCGVIINSRILCDHTTGRLLHIVSWFAAPGAALWCCNAQLCPSWKLQILQMKMGRWFSAKLWFLHCFSNEETSLALNYMKLILTIGNYCWSHKLYIHLNYLRIYHRVDHLYAGSDQHVLDTCGANVASLCGPFVVFFWVSARLAPVQGGLTFL